MTEESKGGAEFPPELWVEILLRLPAKPLVRFRCVSKTWRSVIDNPKFTHKHLSLWKHGPPSGKKMVLSWESGDSKAHRKHVQKFMLRTMDEFRNVEEIMAFSMDTPREFSYRPISYADGLVLIQRKRKIQKSSEYILYNHSIRKVVVLPPPPRCNVGCFHFLLGLDPLNNEHKVFMILFPFSARDGSAFITFAYYTLSTGCWSSARTKEENRYSWNCLLGTGFYAKGAMHWLYRERIVPIFGTEDPVYTHVLSFDIVTEALSLTSLPGDQSCNTAGVRIPFLVHDAFSILEISGGSVCIWILEQHGESKTHSWSKWYQRPTDYYIEVLYHPYLDTPAEYEPILYCGKGKVLVVRSRVEIRDDTDDEDEIEDHIGDEINFCDFESGMVEVFDVSPSRHVVNLMGPYVESLLLANASSDHCWTTIPEENRYRLFNPKAFY